MKERINNTLNSFKNKVEQERGKNWVFLIFLEPNIYLFGLLRKTIIMGLILALIYELFSFLNVHEQPIPTSWHSSAGIVIGLLLVFRTNTAYDRWWEARKLFSNLESIIIYIKISSTGIEEKKVKKSLSLINSYIFEFVSESNKDKSEYLRKKIIKEIEALRYIFYTHEYKNYSISNLDKKISELFDVLTSLERIKETPIPDSYSLHIKTSLFLYILSLPFGLFYGLGFNSYGYGFIFYNSRNRDYKQ